MSVVLDDLVSSFKCLLWYMSRRAGLLLPVSNWAVYITCCTALQARVVQHGHHTVMQLLKILSLCCTCGQQWLATRPCWIYMTPLQQKCWHVLLKGIWQAWCISLIMNYLLCLFVLAPYLGVTFLLSNTVLGDIVMNEIARLYLPHSVIILSTSCWEDIIFKVWQYTCHILSLTISIASLPSFVWIHDRNNQIFLLHLQKLDKRLC